MVNSIRILKDRKSKRNLLSKQKSVSLFTKPSAVTLQPVKASKRNTLRAAQSQISVDRSQDAGEEKTVEASIDEKEDIPFPAWTPTDVSATNRSTSQFSLINVELPKEFSEINKFMQCILLTRNMVVELLSSDLMHLIIAGDQIHSICGEMVHNMNHLIVQFQKAASSRTPISICFIRPWNIRCPTKTQLSNLIQVDERYQYFVVRIHQLQPIHGFTMKVEKRKLVVTNIRPKSNGAYAFCKGDQIFEIDGLTIAPPMSGQKIDIKTIQKRYNKTLKTVGYVDCFCCRRIGVRSAPNPSVLEEANINCRPASAENLDPSLEIDALEISLRELCRIQAMTANDMMPPPFKGKSLLKSDLPKVGSVPSGIEKSVYADVSRRCSASPLPGAQPQVPVPRNTSRRYKWRRGNSRQNQISFKEQTETSKIMSDVADEVELKKVDARSGIVAYIKNAFG